MPEPVKSASGKQLQCVVVTPEKAILDVAADFVAVPLFDGELGVLPGRAPLVGRLGYGELRIRSGAKVERYFIDGGFVQVRADVVTVLTQRAIKAEAIKPEEVKKTLAETHKHVATPEARDAQRKTQERARAELRVAHHSRAGGTTPPGHV